MIVEKRKASSKKGTPEGHVHAVLLVDGDTRIEMTLTYSTLILSYPPESQLSSFTLQLSVMLVGDPRTSCMPRLKMESLPPLSNFTTVPVSTSPQVKTGVTPL